MAGFAPDVDGSAVGFDDGADEAEAEAKSGRGAALLRAVEAVPDFRQIFFVDSRSLILNRKRYLPVFR